MSDKSPRQSKKAGKSIKEKRSDKRAKAAGDAAGSMETLSKRKR